MYSPDPVHMLVVQEVQVAQAWESARLFFGNPQAVTCAMNQKTKRQLLIPQPCCGHRFSVSGTNPATRCVQRSIQRTWENQHDYKGLLKSARAQSLWPRGNSKNKNSAQTYLLQSPRAPSWEPKRTKGLKNSCPKCHIGKRPKGLAGRERREGPMPTTLCEGQ